VAAVPPIVDAYIKANFGSATDRANSICYRGVVEQNAVKREFVLFKKRPRLLRVHIVKDGFVVGVMGFDGTTAWTESPGRLPVAAVGREAEMLTNWSRFDDPLVGYSERGAEVRLKDRPANGPIQLDIRESDGTEMIAAIDPATYKEVSLRIRRTDGRWRELRFRDYRRVGPVNVAYLQEEWDGGVLRSTTQFSQLTLDPGLLDRFFARPTAMAFDFMDFMGGLAVWEYRERRAAAATAHPIGLAR
jgi:hypothetical protein